MVLCRLAANIGLYIAPINLIIQFTLIAQQLRSSAYKTVSHEMIRKNMPIDGHTGVRLLSLVKE